MFLAIYAETKVSYQEKPQKLKNLTKYQWFSFALIFIVPFVVVSNFNGDKTELFYIVLFIFLVANFGIAAHINQKRTEALQIRKAEFLMRTDEEIAYKLRRIQQVEIAMYHQKPELLLALHRMKPKEVEVKPDEEKTNGDESGGAMAVISHRAKRITKRVVERLSRNRR
ncbi:hypothetical protein JZO70_13860 [Enterococcus sp. 669A]|uniref:Septum formation initiator n=1 Tax=Candidatus Enterococcus moelleringii TaxID=2815325 RepID=A0ABS3LC96_9ENTE|nr:hypothetical protein [Enterococcus sp. 669A]MBO1307258.1 hypothetical protein [Enterococcus sp. 669A]